MRNIKLIIQYDGTNYHGWQIQSACATIQGTVQEAVRSMVKGVPVKLLGASRTDTGVHALGQAAHFTIPNEITISCHSFWRGLNSLTPDDIVIAEVHNADPDFHSRFDARGKTYCYQVYNALVPHIYHRRFSWHIRCPLELDAMRKAARYLLGCHDFTSFQASTCSSESPIRTVFGLHIYQRCDIVRIFIRANAYLHHMVRNIAGTLIDIGMKKYPPEEMQRILAAKNRRFAGVTAPPQGLFLVKVHY